jgi:hypothetical protein
VRALADAIEPSGSKYARADKQRRGHERNGPDTRVRRPQQGAILSAMSTDSQPIPAKPTLDGLEDKWTQRWAKERVVQV